MELRALRYFLTIANVENFSRAADILHVTQPTMSRQMTQLEKELGVKLFQRTTRNVVLTEDGMLLRRRAEEILSLTDKATQEMMQQGQELEGTVSISSGEYEAFNILTDYIRSFSEQHPKVHFNIVSEPADRARDHLERGLVDIAVMLEPVDTGKFEAVPLPSIEQYTVLMRPDDPLARLKEIRQKDLARNPQIISLRRVDPYKRWMGEYYEEENVRFTVNLPNNGAIMVLNGLGYFITIRSVAAFFEKAGLVYRPIRGAKDWKVFFTWKRYQPNSRAVSRFIEHVLQELGLQRTEE